MTEQLDRDYIRQHMTREQIQAALKADGIAVYERESFEELVAALAEHCMTKRVAPEGVLTQAGRT